MLHTPAAQTIEATIPPAAERRLPVAATVWLWFRRSATNRFTSYLTSLHATHPAIPRLNRQTALRSESESPN